MAQRTVIRRESGGLTIRISSERDSWTLLGLPLMSVVLARVTYVLKIGWAGLFLWGMLLWMVWKITWAAFGSGTVAINDLGMTLTDQILGLRRSRQFAAEDVEWISYHHHAYDSPAGIGVMLRSRMLPIQFGSELSPAEGEQVMTAIKEIQGQGGWLSSKVRRDGHF